MVRSVDKERNEMKKWVWFKVTQVMVKWGKGQFIPVLAVKVCVTVQV